MSDPDSSLKTFELPSSVDPEAWTFRVNGAVEQVLELNTSELEELYYSTVNDDFSCLEGWTAEGIEWQGVPISAILDRAEPSGEAAFGLVHGMDDDYACGLELDRLSDGLLALEMDGSPLSVEHGGPARLVLPDEESDCFESVKWATRLEVLDHQPTKRDTAADIALGRLDRETRPRGSPERF